jgi:hypothetical protein
MCVSCEFNADGSVSTQYDPETDVTRSYMTVCPNQSDIVLDFPIEWVSTIKVTKMAEPYGPELFNGSARYRTDEWNALISAGTAVYACLAVVGDNYANSYHGVLIVGDGDKAPFVRIKMNRPR